MSEVEQKAPTTKRAHSPKQAAPKPAKLAPWPSPFEVLPPGVYQLASLPAAPGDAVAHDLPKQRVQEARRIEMPDRGTQATLPELSAPARFQGGARAALARLQTLEPELRKSAHALAVRAERAPVELRHRFLDHSGEAITLHQALAQLPQLPRETWPFRGLVEM